MRVFKNILIWFFFSLILSILPIVSSIIKLYNLNYSVNIYNIIKDVISHGEVYLVTIATLGVGVGELFKEEPKWRIFHIMLGGGTIIVFYFATSYFTDVSSSTNYNKNFIYDSSLILLVAAMIFTLSSFIIPKVEKEKKQ
jgi:hypothetical protein